MESELTAPCIAVIKAEHAVAYATLGPVKLRKKETRLAIIAILELVAEYSSHPKVGTKRDVAPI